MKWLVSFGLLLCIGILVGAACAAPGATPAQPPGGGQETPTATDTPTPEAPPKYLISLVQNTYTVTIPSIDDYSEVERKAGCTSPFPFDGREAYARYPQEHWLLWTFSVSFESFSKEKEGGPLGCLRLYQRKDSTFELIKNGNILVDTCKVKPGVTFGSGYAIFDGTGHITCMMNLSDWVTKLSIPLGLVLTRTVDARTVTVSNTFTSTHTYENFTIAADIVPTAASIDKLLPLVYYQPNDPNAAQPNLALRSKKLSPLQLSAEGCNQIIEDPDEQIWWYDLHGPTEATPTPYSHFAHNPLDGSLGYDKYRTSLCHTDGGMRLEFSLEEAKLYIGYEPEDGINDFSPKRTFTGAIDAILIDPTDSKPEK